MMPDGLSMIPFGSSMILYCFSMIPYGLSLVSYGLSSGSASTRESDQNQKQGKHIVDQHPGISKSTCDSLWSKVNVRKRQRQLQYPGSNPEQKKIKRLLLRTFRCTWGCAGVVRGLCGHFGSQGHIHRLTKPQNQHVRPYPTSQTTQMHGIFKIYCSIHDFVRPGKQTLKLGNLPMHAKSMTLLIQASKIIDSGACPGKLDKQSKTIDLVDCQCK